MLVPATVEDLRVGGKIIVGTEENSNGSQVKSQVNSDKSRHNILLHFFIQKTADDE